MPSYTAEGIRNIALVGQSGGGKTTLVEALGHRIHFFPGESRNIKITRQEDLALAELMI